MRGYLHCFVVLLLGGLCSAGPAGTEFATGFMENYKADYQKGTRFVIEVSAPITSQGSTQVKVSALGKVYEKTVEPGKGVNFQLPNGVEMVGSTGNRPTVLIEASQEVTVLSLNFKDGTADTSVVYPVKEWGTEYYLFTPKDTPLGTFKEFSITNHKDRNSVVVLLRATVKFQKTVYQAGSKLTLDLEPFESVQIQSLDDLTGSKVSSTHPVAVSTGHSCTYKYSECNHVYEQLLPVTSWGKEFIIAPLPYKSDGKRYDSVFIQASQATIVKVTTGGATFTIPLKTGQTSELPSFWPKSIHFASDKGIQVLFLFNGGQMSNNLYYDPFLMTILPTTLFSTSYSLEGQMDFTNGLIIVARSTDLAGLMLDKTHISKELHWQGVEGSKYSWTQVLYNSGASFKQIANPDSPFAIYSYGVALANGYGSPATGNPPAKRDCSSITCPKDEQCQMKGSNDPTCVKKQQLKAGTCWAMGDPHYRSFDGHYYNFMGNCTYTMAKNCHVDQEHPAFEVEAKNENRAGSKVTFVGKVIITVYGVTITIVRGEVGLVRINYQLWNLPINLDNGKVKVTQSGLSVVVETDFGLMVQYDWEQYLMVTVPGSLAGKVCGLCGNFNGKQEDDLTTPSGSPAKDVVALGKSWKVPGVEGEAYCRDECNGQCGNCDSESIFEHLAHRAFCEVLTRVMDGPFGDCHAVIEPKAYHDNCLYDVCMGEGMLKFLCDTLQVYSDVCQRAGVKVHNWRGIAHCPMPNCPENSHYELCGSACPATCEDPDAPSRCKASCVEACTCNQGFFRSGNKCVPKTQCGCQYKGHYVEAGASFWGDENCIQRCTCINRQVECKKTGCPLGKECQVVDGLRGCQPLTYAECSVSGDPHYRTFDHHHYNFQGTCVYQMAGVCSNDTSLEKFDVQVQTDGSGKQAGSSAKLVEVNVYGISIVITKTHKGSILVNGELTNLPVKLADGRVGVFMSAGSAMIQTDFGVKVAYDWQSTAAISVPNTYAGAMCGLCGNYNLNPKDDLKMKGGKLAATVEELGQSWRVAEIPGCVHGCKDKNHCPNCDITQKEKFETDAFCGRIRDPKGPFRNCHAVVDPSSYFEDCVYDVCLSNGRGDSLCSSLQTYTAVCQQKGVEVFEWRSKDFCSFKHPPHSHYEVCADGCPATCDRLSAPAGCKALCQEGWVCDEGFLLSGDQCVPLAQCGCLYKDRYYKKGQVFFPNGLCQEECICNGTVECYQVTCGPNEKCEVKNGVRACQPFGNATCSISGDPHYNTFDNSTYDFQGTCTYTAAKACHLEGTRLTPFTVVVENEKWYAMSADPMVSVAKLVIVEVYGDVLILRKNQIGMVMVNGLMTNLPLTLHDGAVQVFQGGTYDVIMTDFGLRVTYDLVYHVTVTVPGNYRGKTCGLCGNFNDRKDDDLRMPDGKETRDVVAFGAAWAVGVSGVVCENGCSGDFCPKCDAKKKPVFEKDCSIIKNPQGPFAACHSVIDPASYYRDCVYDVCLAKGDRNTLCLSIAAYMMDCQNVGVKIGVWRTPQFCPLSCPANSHYQVCSETCEYPCPGLSETISCPTTCAEGCACNPEYYFNGTGCVPWDQCSCYFDGITYKIGESLLSQDCMELCTCMASGRVECHQHTCNNGDSCQVQKGLRGCYPTQCTVKNGGSFTPFNGSPGTITAEGSYQLLKVCDQTLGAEWFRVVVKMEECGKAGVNSVLAVYVFFDNLFISVNSKHETWINGKEVPLPSLQKNGISVTVAEKAVLIEKKSALQVSYSLSQEVIITVSESMANKVCGACGQPIATKGAGVDAFIQQTMQAYMNSWAAPDFPTCPV